jgi:hypothetical protein
MTLSYDDYHDNDDDELFIMNSFDPSVTLATRTRDM